MKTIWTSAIVTLAMLLSSPVLAQSNWNPENTAKVEKLFAEGAALYRSQKYRSAIEKFEAAYALYPDPNLLYNMGRCYEALGEIDAAIEHYDRCIQQSENAGLVKKAQQRSSALKKAKAVSAVPPPKSSPPPEVTKTPPTTGTASGPESEVTTPPPVEGSLGLTVGKWVVGAASVGLLAGGTVLFLAGSSDHAEVDDAKTAAGEGIADLTYNQASDLIDSGRRNKAIGVTLLSVGAAAAVGSVVMFLLDIDEPAPSFGFIHTDEERAFVVGGTF